MQEELDVKIYENTEQLKTLIDEKSNLIAT